jgi:preprotein translocase subunit SecY
MFLTNLFQVFKIEDLRKKILFILAIFAIFRFLAHIPIPGIKPQELQAFFETFRMLGILNIFAGGALERVSIVMLGMGPYITAVVILQLLTMVFPQLEKLYKEEGELGREKFEQYGRILTVPIAALQAFAMLTFFSRQGAIASLSFFDTLVAVFTVTAGTIFLMWLGEIITSQGLGNGVSLLILAGIIADFPSNVGTMIIQFREFLELNYPFSKILSLYLLFILMVLFIIYGVTIVTEAKREIPVVYSKRIRGRVMYGGVSSYLPISVNPAGVMPIIFALSLLTLPSMFIGFFSKHPGVLGKIAQELSLILENPIIHGALYFIFVFVFTYFYTMVVFDPKTIAENLQKSGGFIPGIRPGESTKKYLNETLKKILPFGALFLAIIAIMPTIVGSITKIVAFEFLVGGTSVLILVSVILETLREINAQLQMREYEKI